MIARLEREQSAETVEEALDQDFEKRGLAGDLHSAQPVAFWTWGEAHQLLDDLL